MASISLISKVHLGSGNYEYTYKCTCNNSSNEIKVTSGNDIQARMLAQLECDDTCNVTRMTTEQTTDLRHLLQESGKIHESSFVASVNEVGTDSYSMSLCTGDKVVVPKKILKSFEFIGILENGNQLHQIAKLTFDTESEQGLLILQLCNIIEKLTTTDEENTFSPILKQGEQHIQIKVLCSGRACSPTHSFFTSSKPIIQHSLRKVEGCVVNNVTKLGSYKLRVLHSALGGTVCGTNYSGRAYFDLIVKT